MRRFRGFRWFSKRARAAARAPEAAGSPPPPAAAAPSSPADEIVLWRCNKQMQARLMFLAAGAQGLLAAAYFDSLWLVKKGEAKQVNILCLCVCVYVLIAVPPTANDAGARGRAA